MKENKVDAIVSTGPPHTTHLIALNVAPQLKIPWLADFRDPWTNIDFYHKLKLTGWADKKHKRLELKVLNHADKVVTVTWSWAEDFLRISGKKPVVITNGYDPADFEKAGLLELDDKFSITHARPCALKMLCGTRQAPRRSISATVPLGHEVECLQCPVIPEGPDDG